MKASVRHRKKGGALHYLKRVKQHTKGLFLALIGCISALAQKLPRDWIIAAGVIVLVLITKLIELGYADRLLKTVITT